MNNELTYVMWRIGGAGAAGRGSSSRPIHQEATLTLVIAADPVVDQEAHSNDDSCETNIVQIS